MRGLVVDKSKSLDLVDDLPQPVAKKREVVVKVEYTAVNSFDLELASGKYDYVQRFKKSMVKSGIEFAGIVQTQGEKFSTGDHVFGYIDILRGVNTHADYVSIREDFIAPIPKSLTMAEAAALPMSSLTALDAFQDAIAVGTRVLINGASGGVGVYAVQVAKIYDAHVTAVAGTNQTSFLQSLGADVVIDYHETDITQLSQKFDIIFDLSNLLKFGQIQHLLSRNGVFIPADPLKNIFGFVHAAVCTKKVKYLMVSHGDTTKLNQISRWIDAKKLKPIVEHVYPLDQFEQAFKRAGEKGHQGKIVLAL